MMAVLAEAGVALAKIDVFTHGTTIVINALTDQKGAATGLITTAGFHDVLEIARGNRPDFFHLAYRRPEPFVPRRPRREIAGRMNYAGEDGVVRRPRSTR